MRLTASTLLKNKWITWGLVFALLAMMFATAVTSVKDDSITGDEIIYPAAGYSYWLYHRYDINFEHAPLGKLITAIPYLFSRPNLDEKEIGHNQWGFGQGFFYDWNRGQTDQLLFDARLMVMLLMVLFGIFLYWAINRWWGNATALLSVTVYALAPSILAHARLATFDFPVSVFMFMAVYLFLDWLKSNSWRSAVLAGVVYGLAQSTKFSALLLVPIFLVLIGLKIWLQPVLKKLRLRFLFQIITVHLLCFAVLWGTYFLAASQTAPQEVDAMIRGTTQDSKTPNPEAWRTVLTPLNSNIVTRPLAVYGAGVLRSFNYTRGPITNFPQYLFGSFSDMGWWYYYLAAFIIKEPIPILLLLLGTLITIILPKKKRKPDIRLIGWWVTLIGLTILTMGGNLNIGYRYVLPILPILYVLLSKHFLQFTQWLATVSRSKLSYLGVAVILLWLLVENIFVFPAYLSYFNQFAGGPSNGYRYLIDSNLDWGQDLYRLRSWVQENKINHIYVDYFGQGSLEHYLDGIGYERRSVDDGLPNGFLAVSVTFLESSQAIHAKNKDAITYEPLTHLTPVADIGHSIFVYDLRKK